MKTLYQIVGMAGLDGSALLTAEEIAERFPSDKVQEGTHLRPELVGEPILPNLCGPMWGGWRDASGDYVHLTNDRDPESPPQSYSPSKGPIVAKVIRYETWEAYEHLSR